jgi:hypothetical protein
LAIVFGVFIGTLLDKHVFVAILETQTKYKQVGVKKHGSTMSHKAIKFKSAHWLKCKEQVYRLFLLTLKDQRNKNSNKNRIRKKYAKLKKKNLWGVFLNIILGILIWRFR